jgi:competence protein ComEA
MTSVKNCLGIVLLLLAGFAFAGETVNINQADAESLALAIKGVGHKRAEAIIEYREQYGPFQSVDELTQVQGIGEKLLEGSRQNLTVQAGES